MSPGTGIVRTGAPHTLVRWLLTDLRPVRIWCASSRTGLSPLLFGFGPPELAVLGPPPKEPPLRNRTRRQIAFVPRLFTLCARFNVTSMLLAVPVTLTS